MAGLCSDFVVRVRVTVVLEHRSNSHTQHPGRQPTAALRCRKPKPQLCKTLPHRQAKMGYGGSEALTTFSRLSRRMGKAAAGLSAASSMRQYAQRTNTNSYCDMDAADHDEDWIDCSPSPQTQCPTDMELDSPVPAHHRAPLCREESLVQQYHFSSVSPPQCAATAPATAQRSSEAQTQVKLRPYHTYSDTSSLGDSCSSHSSVESHPVDDLY